MLVLCPSLAYMPKLETFWELHSKSHKHDPNPPHRIVLVSALHNLHRNHEQGPYVH